ncbi:flavin reductase (DIM6/NTAB) family NADH-FMN oxidoreductase RutF [Evansella vedderi]|uniref:Flavin reductase (DIM6/NTAB) family NADH-FMN oxidoreductase RutF n=1 Tax=Evansella vedderi TaxID=38282 RepID=A0ABT9ZNJ5_9BACI|nr:flavin reductase family protein [Evansella vedderi]MDQ0252810.1 flavin reductase (DIM6/NTAB) family NADH-FMN oxidoreductase RutF [Evansella vedderi]
MSSISSDKNFKNRLVDSEKFRNVIGNFASGVSIITVRNNETNYGITASAVSSVSLDPPMLLVCVNKKTGTCNAISEKGSFTVNILLENQGELALQFAKVNTEKFNGVDFAFGELGNPVLKDQLAVLECRVVEEVTGGTHSIFLAEVHNASAVEGDPLVYFKGQFGQFQKC